MNWDKHYTGISVAESSWGPFNLYLQRNENDKKLTMARLTILIWRDRETSDFYKRFWLNKMFGLFLGRVNYLNQNYSNYGGWEFFTNHYSIGWIKNVGTHAPRMSWSGSIAEPLTAVVFRLGHIGFALHKAPKFLVRRAEARLAAEWAKYEQSMPKLPQWQLDEIAKLEAEMDYGDRSMTDPYANE